MNKRQIFQALKKYYDECCKSAWPAADANHDIIHGAWYDAECGVIKTGDTHSPICWANGGRA